MLFRETVAVHCEDHMKYIHSLLAKCGSFEMVKQVVDIATIGALKGYIISLELATRQIYKNLKDVNITKTLST
jgi:uncharacterized protein (DUF4213/DUF364 family)